MKLDVTELYLSTGGGESSFWNLFFWNHHYLGVEWVFTSTVSRNLSGLFVLLSGLKPEVLAMLLVEFWDFSLTPNTDGFVIGKEIATCGFLHHRCFRTSSHIALVLTWTRWWSHCPLPVVFHLNRQLYAQNHWTHSGTYSALHADPNARGRLAQARLSKKLKEVWPKAHLSATLG